jgi:cytochrome bd-type quinol oxidase subunit 1
MKLCTIVNYLGWASGIFGALLMLAGVIGFFIGKEFLGVANFYNYFFIANSFLFLGIFILVGTRCFCCCTCNSEEKDK